VPHFGLLDKLSNQWVGATAMWAAQGKIKKKYNITDERAALHAALGDWAAQVSGPGKAPFLGGAVPNYGDVAVYACLRAIEGLDAWKEIMAGNEAVAAWYGRVEHAFGASGGVRGVLVCGGGGGFAAYWGIVWWGGAAGVMKE
jgi:microsomal prostaglandin-E synthase 2